MASLFANARHTVRWGLITTLGLVLGAPTQARGDTLLRWKFRSGETLNYTMTTSSRQEMNVNGTVAKMAMDQIADQTWKVAAVSSDGTATVSQTIDRVRMEMKSTQGDQNQAIKYDSADAEKPTDTFAKTMAQVMEPMIGKVITMEVNPRGELMKFKAPEEMFSGVRKAPGMEQMGGMFSEEGMKQMTAQSMLKFPEAQVAKGAAWTSSFEMPNPLLGKQKVLSTYTYSGSEKIGGQDLEKISLTLKMEFDLPKDSPTKLVLKDQKSDGAIYFDNVAGHVVETDNTTSMKMEISAGGMTFDTDSTTKTSLKLNKSK